MKGRALAGGLVVALLSIMALMQPAGVSAGANAPAAPSLYSASASIPFPVTTHPRIWVTAAELPQLRRWAVSSNPIYKQGWLPFFDNALHTYRTAFAPFFTARPPQTAYPDPGDTQGYQGDLSEEYGVVLAFGSLIAHGSTLRRRYAHDARNLLMYALDRAAKGPASNVPFRDPMFAVYNRANATGQDWPLIVDWIYPSLTTADKRTVRKVFMMWAADCLNASTTGGDHPSPVGVMNDHSLLPGGNAYRMAANNYYLGHARLLTMMALSIDPADDPPVDPSKPVSMLGNSLRGYLADATGAWLYQDFAMFEDPATVIKDLKLQPGASVGLASGGLPPEGMLYGHSFGFLLGQLLALQTAGFDKTSLIGRQAKLITAPVWRRMVSGFISSLVPAAKVMPGYTYYGPVYQMTSYGDLLRLWMTPDFMQPLALLDQLERQAGETTSGQPVDSNAARWWLTDALQGGAGYLYARITSPWNDIEPILYFLAMAPHQKPIRDPRPSMPTLFVDPHAGRLIVRTGWGPNATLFDYRASWISINHQDGDAGQFELYRHGEWLTKELSNYDSNGLGQTSPYHNTMSLQNKAPVGTPANLQWFETPEWDEGSQWDLGQNAGDPTTVISRGRGYVSAASDLTNPYNRPSFWTPQNAALEVTGASRSIIWLDGDYVVIYDRATTTDSGLFKRENFELTNPPSISAGAVKEVTPDGQRLFLQSLLPANPSITYINAAKKLTFVAGMEPTQYTLTIQAPSDPANTRFLDVLQGAGAKTAMVPATTVHSLSGDSFDGAQFGHFTVYFSNDLHQPFHGVDVARPPAGRVVLITGLPPSQTVQVTQTATQIDLTPSTTGVKSDASGVLEIRV